MTVFVKKYQNTNEKMTKMYRKWYGKTVIVDKVEIDQLANEIQDNCTVKRSDILAVLSELGPAIKKELQRSMKVYIPYLGSFKMVVHSTGTDTPEDYDVNTNIVSVRPRFIPETKLDNKHRVAELVKGVRISELPKNMSYLAEDGEENNDTPSGGAVEEQP